MMEAYCQMPEDKKRELHEWEAKNLPNVPTSEWPGWYQAVDQLTQNAKVRARLRVRGEIV
jgi:hypothetical protein